MGIILPGENVFEGNHRDIVIHLQPWHYCNPHDNQEHVQLHCISEGYATCAPLHYVVLFPFGELGWYYELQVPNNPR